MCRIIAIANQKGGVGKTTTCVNLGIGLAREGKKVLLVEADAQGSMAVSFGIQEPDELDVTLVNIMEKIINDEDVEPGEGIIHHKEGIDFIPANIELAGLETSLVNVMSREQVLRLYLDEIKADYDELFVMAMFEKNSRIETMQEIRRILPFVKEDAEMLNLINATLKKMERLTDQEFSAIDLEVYRQETMEDAE